MSTAAEVSRYRSNSEPLPALPDPVKASLPQPFHSSEPLRPLNPLPESRPPPRPPPRSRPRPSATAPAAKTPSKILSWHPQPGSTSRTLLGYLSRDSRQTPTAILSIDTEYNMSNKTITELGIAIQFSRAPPVRRHIIVGGGRRHAKVFGFGASEHVQTQKELVPILQDIITDLEVNHHVIVLVGHGISCDISSLGWIGWQIPARAIILDTHKIWLASNKATSGGNLGDAVRAYGIPLPQDIDPFHNAGNDAHFAMELLLHKAEQLMEEKPYQLADRPSYQGPSYQVPSPPNLTSPTTAPPALQDTPTAPRSWRYRKRRRADAHDTTGITGGDQKRREVDTGNMYTEDMDKEQKDV